MQRRARVHAALGDVTRLRLVEELRLTDRTPGELRRLVGIDSNLMAHHLDVLEEAGAITRHASAGDGRRRYVSLNTDFVGPLIPEKRLSAETVVFVCTHNSARSQFAEALVNARSSIAAFSAGLRPSDSVHPRAIEVAREHGLDLSGAVPKSYDSVRVRPDLVVSVCDRACEAPIPIPAERLHWSIPDPVESGRLDAFRSAFQDVSRRADVLMKAIA